MNRPDLPQTRDIVLVGGGHTHALVLRRWGMRPLAGARLTLINPGPTAPYSGMLPGHVAGHYPREALDIDLVRLARFAGARLILGAAEGLDLDARQVRVPGRPPVAYDICSLDVGITSTMPGLEGFDLYAVPAKPLAPFAARWREFLDLPGPARVAVLGAGVAGVELSMAMAFALRARGREGEVVLIDRSAALPGLGRQADARLRRHLERNRVRVIEHAEAARIEAQGVRLADGTLVEAGFVTGAAGAAPYDWLAASGLAVENGFVRVGADLRSSDPAVFAAGDCAHMVHDPRPKAGVYAVRQAPVLFANLRAAASGGTMKAYRPQRDYLKLISLGRKSALAERFGLAVSGPPLWRLKDRIDQRFMDRFRDLPAMTPPPPPREAAAGLGEALGEKPLCGGCGAKLGRAALAATLPAGPARRSDVERLPGDDAALLRTGGAAQVISTDHLRAFVEDPWLMTRIAAIHALGDIWAMGAEPQAATASVILPRLSPELQRRTLAEVMDAAHDVMREAGAEIVGGHSSQGAELTIGFTVTGLCPRPPVTLAGGRPGDALILTKPIGSGVLMAAEMAGRAEGAWVASALRQMATPQGNAARCLSAARAMTDVTGFGLAGHLANICEASGTGAEIDPDAVPLMEGAREMAQAGVRSTLFAENRALAPHLPEGGAADLLFDPQTAGGLLAAVPEDAAAGALAALRAAGVPAVRIGRLIDGPPYPVAAALR